MHYGDGLIYQGVLCFDPEKHLKLLKKGTAKHAEAIHNSWYITGMLILPKADLHHWKNWIFNMERGNLRVKKTFHKESFDF